MRYVSATEAKQALAAVLDAAQREPVATLNIEEFQRFCDRIGERAKQRGLTEDRLSELLSSDS